MPWPFQKGAFVMAHQIGAPLSRWHLRSYRSIGKDAGYCGRPKITVHLHDTIETKTFRKRKSGR